MQEVVRIKEELLDLNYLEYFILRILKNGNKYKNLKLLNLTF